MALQVYEAADNEESFDVVYLDFNTAFDKVPHQRLLNKVRAYGIEGRVYEWIRAWNSNRKQRVSNNGKKNLNGIVLGVGTSGFSVRSTFIYHLYI